MRRVGTCGDEPGDGGQRLVWVVQVAELVLRYVAQRLGQIAAVGVACHVVLQFGGVVAGSVGRGGGIVGKFLNLVAVKLRGAGDVLEESHELIEAVFACEDDAQVVACHGGLLAGRPLADERLVVGDGLVHVAGLVVEQGKLQQGVARLRRVGICRHQSVECLFGLVGGAVFGVGDGLLQLGGGVPFGVGETFQHLAKHTRFAGVVAVHAQDYCLAHHGVVGVLIA